MGRRETGERIQYRKLTQLSEFEQLIEIQREVWGFADVEIVPSRLFLIAHKVGGQVIGAEDGERIIGYCFSLPGIRRDTGGIYLHSHMLAVLPDYRNRGIGRQLKLEQRKEALERGIDLIEWTFDPLELKNAYLNIERLGVIVRRYIRNYYGITTSKLHSGMPTDRCVAEWHLDTERTRRILEGGEREREPVVERIPIPADIARIRHENIREALRIQREATEKFEECFDRGLAVTGFERSEKYGTYLLSPWP